jgi:membrane-associated protease RseP (regulator of RpoE activity)
MARLFPGFPPVIGVVMETEECSSPIPTVAPTLETESGQSAQAGGKAVWLPVALFLLTGLTTLLAGAYQEGRDPFQRPADLVYGLPFSFTLMAILFCHEMGHYLVSKRYGVQTTLPYFIPGPWPPFGLIGTFGAFIRMKSPILVKMP